MRIGLYQGMFGRKCRRGAAIFKLFLLNRVSVTPEIGDNFLSIEGAGYFKNHAGYLQLVPDDVPKMEGARLVANLLTSSTSPTTQVLLAQPAAPYVLRIGQSGTVSISGSIDGAFGAVTTAAGEEKALSFAGTATQDITITVTVQPDNFQLENKTSYPLAEQTIPSEYVATGLSSPWHGANRDGYRYFGTVLANTVDIDSVITAAIGAPLADVVGRMYEPADSNVLLNSETHSDWSTTWGSGVVLTFNAGVGVSNRLSMSRVQQTSTSGDGIFRSHPEVPGAIYNLTVEIKNIDALRSRLFIWSFATGIFAEIRISWAGATPSLLSSSGSVDTTTISFVEVISGIWCISFKYVASLALVTNPLVILYPENQVSETRAVLLGNVKISPGALKMSRVVTTNAAATRATVSDQKVWPANLVNNFNLKLTFNYNGFDSTNAAFLLGVGAAANRFEAYVDSTTGAINLRVTIAGLATTIVADNALIVGNTYDVEFIYDGGMSMLIDTVAQADTNPIVADIGWADPETLYIGSDYQGNSGIVANITNISIQ